MKIETNVSQAFVAIESVVDTVMQAQANDGDIDINEGIQIAVKALDEITKVFIDEEGKLQKIIDSLKDMLNQLIGYLKDGKISRFEIILLSIKLVQVITDIVNVLN